MLEVIMGCMYSGKSTELMRRLDIEQIALKYADVTYDQVLLFKPNLDNRYSETDVVSHDGISKTATCVSSHEDILNDIRITSTTAVVGIDEAQFFGEELIDTVSYLVHSLGKHVIIAGLDTDFRNEPFPTMVPLAFKADKLTKLSAVCFQCGSQNATKTQRIVEGQPSITGDVVQVGGTESYEARCNLCYRFHT